jgi:hypothetical protein
MERFDLGKYSRRISTASTDAQRWFDAGLNWCYAFNKTEGTKCFRKAFATRRELRKDDRGQGCSRALRGFSRAAFARKADPLVIDA